MPPVETTVVAGLLIRVSGGFHHLGFLQFLRYLGRLAEDVRGIMQLNGRVVGKRFQHGAVAADGQQAEAETPPQFRFRQAFAAVQAPVHLVGFGFELA